MQLSHVPFAELYDSREPLFFVLFFFTIHLSFKKIGLIFFLLLLQLCASMLIHCVVIGTQDIDRDGHTPRVPIIVQTLLHQHDRLLHRISYYDHVRNCSEYRSSFDHRSTKPGYYLLCEPNRLYRMDTGNKKPLGGMQTAVRLQLFVILNLLYSCAGAVLGFLVCRLFRITKMVKLLCIWNRYQAFGFLLEIFLLFSCFYRVHERIYPTYFPVGNFRTAICFFVVSFVLYVKNRADNPHKSDAARERHWQAYDRSYLVWMCTCAFLLLLHLWTPFHSYVWTACTVGLSALGLCVYGASRQKTHKRKTKSQFV